MACKKGLQKRKRKKKEEKYVSFDCSKTLHQYIITSNIITIHVKIATHNQSTVRAENIELKLAIGDSESGTDQSDAPEFRSWQQS